MYCVIETDSCINMLNVDFLPVDRPYPVIVHPTVSVSRLKSKFLQSQFKLAVANFLFALLNI